MSQMIFFYFEEDDTENCPDNWVYLSDSSQKGLEVLIIGTNVMHHLSVRPLYYQKYYILLLTFVISSKCPRANIQTILLRYCNMFHE